MRIGDAAVNGNGVSHNIIACTRRQKYSCARHIFRLANPRAEIRAAGGREGHLGSLEALALYPANSLFVEGYLTTKGDAVNETYRMIRDAGFEVEGNPVTDAEGFSDPDAVPGRGDFRLAGSDGDILKPEIRRAP